MLKKALNTSAVPPLDVQIQQCESFILRSERRLAEIDAQRLAEEESLTEARRGWSCCGQKRHVICHVVFCEWRQKWPSLPRHT